MELIKKTILQLLTTGTTATTKENEYIIIPDLTAVYHVKFGLKSNINDIGFFDADISYTGNTTITPSSASTTITGTSTSRLNELRKYTITNDFIKQYVSGGTLNSDGVDLLNSNPISSIQYYLGGVKYIDIMSGSSSGTTFNIYKPQGITNLNFINVPYFKNPNKENIIGNPKINDDVFIIRQEQSAFDKNYRLEYINDLNDLNTYAGGNFFNIINNT